MALTTGTPVASVARKKRRPRKSRVIPEAKPLANSGGDMYTGNFNDGPSRASVSPGTPVANVARRRRPRKAPVRRRKPPGLYNDGRDSQEYTYPNGAMPTNPVAQVSSVSASGGAPIPTGNVAPARRPKKSLKRVSKPQPTATRRRPTRPAPKRPNPNRQPFDPVQVPYRTQGDFNQAVDQLARTMYRPQLNDLASQQRTEDQSHLGRVQDIARYYGNYGNELDTAFNDTNSALQELLRTREGGTQASLASLGRAADTSQATAAPLATLLGTTPSSQTAAINDASLGFGEAGSNSVAKMMAAQIAAAAQRRSLAPVAAAEAGRVEDQRNTNVLGNLAEARSKVMAQVPDYRTQARQQLSQQTLAQQNQGFQQGLARDQFGLAKQNQGFQQDLARRQFKLTRDQFDLEQQKFNHAAKLDWANLDLNRQKLIEDSRQFNQQLQQAIQEGASQERIAALRNKQQMAAGKAKRWDSAVQGLSEYLVMNRREQKHPREYRRYFDDAFRLLTGQYKLSATEAYQLLASTSFKSWQRRADYHLRGRTRPWSNESNRLSPSIRRQ